MYAEAWDSPTFDIRFENDRVHDCGFRVAAGSECGGLLSDVWFVNNLIYSNHGPGMTLADWGDQKFQHPVRDVHFIRNTVFNNGNFRWVAECILKPSHQPGRCSWHCSRARSTPPNSISACLRASAAVIPAAIFASIDCSI